MKKVSKEKNYFHRLYNSNLTIFLLFITLIFSFIKVSEEIILRYNINKEIKNLEEQFYKLNNEKENINNLIAYLKTDDYIEEQARLKLNLSKPGEKQINLSNGNNMDLKIKEIDNISNYNNWFNYFFK